MNVTRHHVQQGRLRLIAKSGEERSDFAKNVPTLFGAHEAFIKSEITKWIKAARSGGLEPQ